MKVYVQETKKTYQKMWCISIFSSIYTYRNSEIQYSLPELKPVTEKFGNPMVLTIRK